MSIELPEASIIATQLEKEIIGKRVILASHRYKETMLESGMVNKDTDEIQMLVGTRVNSVHARGNVVLIKFNEETNLVVSPEYGGEVFFHRLSDTVPKEYHLFLEFDDNTSLTVRIKGFGNILVKNDSELEEVYTYSRDFLGALSPLDDEFTFDYFRAKMSSASKALKSMLVGKEAIIVGVQNSAYQDIIYRAKLHPKRKSDSLSDKELRSLFEAINELIEHRMELGGKDQFKDIHGVAGRYIPRMGPNMRDKQCITCGTAIQRLAHGGGHVYICPECQCKK